MPTENRSNTEMIAVPRFIGKEPLNGSYYAAECVRCGWIGSSGECTEDAQCTQACTAGICLGDTEEIGTDRLLGIIQAMAQHQGEPVQRWLIQKTPIGTMMKPNAEGDWVRYEDIAPADAGEVEQLVSANTEYARRHLEQQAEVERLRLEIEQLRFSLEAHDHESVQDDCARAENRALSDEVERLTRKCQNADLALRVQTENCERLRKERQRMDGALVACANERDILRAQLAERDALLSEHQWHYEPYDDHYHRDAGHYCPSCGGEQDSGHKDGCAIAKALSASAEQEKGV